MARFHQGRRHKVKRYRRSFYSRNMKVRRVLGVAALVLAVLAAAWLAAPHVLDLATHTWYTAVRGRDLSASSASQVESVSEQLSASQEETPASSEPEEPAFDGRAITGGSWAQLGRAELTDADAIRTAAQQLKAQGVDYAVITLKDTTGSVYYASGVAAAAGSISDATVDAAQIASILREEGVIPVAQIAAFKDALAPFTDVSMGIRYKTTQLWRDAVKDGNPWLNPYADSAVQYIGDLIEELHGMGYEQVVLTNVQFPRKSSKQEYGTTNGRTRAQQLAADIAALQARFDGSVVLWFSYTMQQCTADSDVLDAAAVTLGMQNLLVTSDAVLDDAAQTELRQTASDAGVQNIVVNDGAIFQ